MTGNSVEDRLARVEGKFLQGEGVRRQLFDDYLALSLALNDASKDLAMWRRSESAAAKELKDAKRQYENREAWLLATNPVEGKNAQERKVATDAMIVEEKKQGLLHDSWEAFCAAEDNLAQCTTDKEIAVDEFSAVRYKLRAVAGLAASLG